MRRRVLIEEFHLSVTIPYDLENKEVEKLRRVLGSPRFHRELTTALAHLFDRFPALVKAKVRVSC